MEKAGRSGTHIKSKKVQLSMQSISLKQAHSRLSENALVTFSEIDAFLA